MDKSQFWRLYYLKFQITSKRGIFQQFFSKSEGSLKIYHYVVISHFEEMKENMKFLIFFKVIDKWVLSIIYQSHLDKRDSVNSQFCNFFENDYTIIVDNLFYLNKRNITKCDFSHWVPSSVTLMGNGVKRSWLHYWDLTWGVITKNYCFDA